MSRVASAAGEFAVRTRLEEVPPDVVSFSRLLLLDTLGALLGGLRYPAVQALARRVAGEDSADVPFGRLMTLGTAATWLDADSGGSFHPQGHRLPPVPTAHPAPHSLPVLLHEAATTGVDDRRLLEVFVVANELGMRAGIASSLRPGLHPHGVHGPGAAAVAAALLRGMSGEEVGAAFVLGSSMPVAATLAVPMQGGTVRNVWTGLGTYYGASAAHRVAGGATGSEHLFSALFDGAVCEGLTTDELLSGLGTTWQIANSYLKPYACARWIHPALDAVQLAMGDEQLTTDDVAAIQIDTFAFAASLNTLDIGSDMQARFSLPYCLAALLTDGNLHAGSFLPEGLSRSPVLDLARRVDLREDAGYTAALPAERPARVTLRTTDGRTLTAGVRNARGNPSSPMSSEDVERKFFVNAANVVAPRLLDRAAEAMAGGEYGRHLSALAAALMVAPCVTEANPSPLDLTVIEDES